MTGSVRVGVDVGGTFTDLVLIDPQSGATRAWKVATHVGDPTASILGGLRALLAATDTPVEAVEFFGHGSTTATNALLERRGARTALITTHGFRDVLEIRRGARPGHALYDLKVALQPSPVPRRLRFEVSERVDSRGRTAEPLDEGAVRDVARQLRARDIEAVAVCLLFSFVNPAHEQAVRRILREELPDAWVSLSSDVLPEFREYERTSTTVVNAYVQPLVSRSLDRLADETQRLGLHGALRIMQSNGGLAGVEVARQRPVAMVLSGPSAGAIAGLHTARSAGCTNAINIDMGGTSFDVSVVADGTLQFATSRRIGDQAIHTSMTEIHTIGAGGGSVAWLDAAGSLRVGPHSAGAQPGPACYGHGGTQATVTDANLVLGFLGEHSLLNGDMPLHSELALDACARLGTQVELNAVELAVGVRRIVNANMTGAIRAMSVARGYDPRDFALIAFGGAGPLHAADLAMELAIPLVIVPPHSGCHSAFGLVVANVRHDYVQTILAPLASASATRAEAAFQDLERRGRADLTADGVAAVSQRLERCVDMRYVGQDSVLTVDCPGGRVVDHVLVGLTSAFHALHLRRYGFNATTEPTEIVNVRVQAVGEIGQSPPPAQPAEPDGHAAHVDWREVHFEGFGLSHTAVYRREFLQPGNEFNGPAIVEQLDATTVVPPHGHVSVDTFGNLLVHLADSLQPSTEVPAADAWLG